MEATPESEMVRAEMLRPGTNASSKRAGRHSPAVRVEKVQVERCNATKYKLRVRVWDESGRVVERREQDSTV